jgi:hypothetical protein
LTLLAINIKTSIFLFFYLIANFSFSKLAIKKYAERQMLKNAINMLIMGRMVDNLKLLMSKNVKVRFF